NIRALSPLYQAAITYNWSSLRERLTISNRAKEASTPLLPLLPVNPARSRACCALSVVKTPNTVGLLDAIFNSVIPWFTASQTYWKCGVSPRITEPNAITPSVCSSNFPTVKGNSYEHGQCATIICSSSIPLALSTSRAPSKSGSVINEFHADTAIPTLQSTCSVWPSIF